MDLKKEALRKLLKLMKTRQAKRVSEYKEGADLSGMSGYLPEMGDSINMQIQRKKVEKAKPYDRVEKKDKK